jgi:hypothetical protein
MPNKKPMYHYGAEGPPKTPEWFLPLFASCALGSVVVFVALLLQSLGLIVF